MKESRLFRILYYLLSNGKTSANELAKQFEVSLRTIYRDIDVISSAGIPIYTTTGRNGGIQLLDNYVLSNTLLSFEEQEKILLAIQSMEATNHEIDKEISLKLNALFQVQVQNWIEIDFSQWGKDDKKIQKFELLKETIIKRIQIKFDYVGGNGQNSHRVVRPAKLIFKSNSWYLIAFCMDKKDFRTFKVSRVNNIKVTNQSFTPLEVPLSDKSIDHNFIHITLHFSKEIMYRVYDEFNYSNIAIQTDSSAIVTVDLPDTEWLIRYLLSFGKHIKIISPINIQEKFVKEIEAMFNMNLK